MDPKGDGGALGACTSEFCSETGDNSAQPPAPASLCRLIPTSFRGRNLGEPRPRGKGVKSHPAIDLEPKMSKSYSHERLLRKKLLLPAQRTAHQTAVCVIMVKPNRTNTRYRSRTEKAKSYFYPKSLGCPDDFEAFLSYQKKTSPHRDLTKQYQEEYDQLRSSSN